MRLINISTGLFEEFIGRNIPKYAILSHTWEEEEVSFKDMSDPSCKTKKGYGKIAMTCRLAAEAGLGYAWVDTCCIDKSSSAELTEAINSMFQWYGRAEVCYVYLSDLAPSAPLHIGLQGCRWFTRGWTLQELIAPEKIDFFDETWSYRGNKIDLIGDLTRITSINIEVLQRTKPLSTFAVAQKMSWAAHRQTTRIEDRAYCLLGIFDVNMAMLYGEEEKAFRRLQEEIIRTTPDYSIFAWTAPPTSESAQSPNKRVFGGVLAPSPLQFSICGPYFMLDQADTSTDFSVSNQGIKMHPRIRLERIPGKRGWRYVLPVCLLKDQTILGIRLRKCGLVQFLREDISNLIVVTHAFFAAIPRSVYLVTQLPENRLTLPSQLYTCESIILRSRPHALQIHLPPEMEVFDIWPWVRWDDEDQIFFLSRDSGQDWGAASLIAAVNFSIRGRSVRVWIDCIFYALGWAQLEDRHVHCTIVNNKLLDAAVHRKLSERIEEKDYQTFEVINELIYHNIPQSGSAIFKVGATDQHVLVYFTLKKVVDPAVCNNVFWRAEFGWKLCGDGEAPQIDDAKWEVRKGD